MEQMPCGYTMDKILKNKVAIVTGSTRGIGLAIATLLAKSGAIVVINSKSSNKKGNNLEKKFKLKNYQIKYIQADVSNGTEVKELFQKTKESFKHIDILVNNAGIYLPENQNKQDLEIYNKIHSINGWGVYNCCKQAEKFMAVNSIIINISSIYAIKPNPDSILASGVKAEVENYTKSFALKYKEKIRVNSIAPGYTNTKLVINNFSDKELNKIINETPQKRLLTPKEIAYSVLYLIKARGITGQSLVLDGGYLL